MAHAMYIINNMVQIAVIIFFVNNLLKPKLKFILIEKSHYEQKVP